MGYRMLIPDVANSEGWKKYFKSDIVRVLGYCEKILGLYNRIATSSSDPLVKKIVMGVIGRDTIGHWRDIQTLFKKFFGIICMNCGDAVRRIAIGVPFDTVINEVSLRTQKTELLEDVRTLSTILSGIARKAMIESGEWSEKETIDIMIKRMSGNPLEVIRLVKGFYSTTISLLPLYNQYTFFLYIARSLYENLVKEYFAALDLSMLARYGIKFKHIRVCRDSGYAIYTPDFDSTAHYINIYVTTAYNMIKKSIRVGLTKFFNIADEEKKFISVMIDEVEKIKLRFSPALTNTIINMIRRSSGARKIMSNHIHYAITEAVFYTEKDQAVVNSNKVRCSDLLEGLAPYILTGLAYFSDFQERDGVAKAYLHIYYM